MPDAPPSHHRAAAACLAVALVLTGCYAAPRPPVSPISPATSATWVRTDLFFGLTRADGRVISDAEWDRFVKNTVTPRFPDGFTVLRADGHYGSTDQSPHQEPARILILFHTPSMATPADARDSDAKINEICQAFATEFNQESVLRTDLPVRTTFRR